MPRYPEKINGKIEDFPPTKPLTLALQIRHNSYSGVRPHEALDLESPASVHQFSTRPYPEIIKAYDYNSNLKIMKVTQNGAIRWKSYHWIYLTATLKGKYVGVEDIGNGIWRVFYRNVFLGYFDENWNSYKVCD